MCTCKNVDVMRSLCTSTKCMCIHVKIVHVHDMCVDVKNVDVRCSLCTYVKIVHVHNMCVHVKDMCVHAKHVYACYMYM